eukprot:3070348-Amphidinium_carterae.1
MLLFFTPVRLGIWNNAVCKGSSGHLKNISPGLSMSLVNGGDNSTMNTSLKCTSCATQMQMVINECAMEGHGTASPTQTMVGTCPWHRSSMKCAALNSSTRATQ